MSLDSYALLSTLPFRSRRCPKQWGGLRLAWCHQVGYGRLHILQCLGWSGSHVWHADCLCLLSGHHSWFGSNPIAACPLSQSTSCFANLNCSWSLFLLLVEDYLRTLCCAYQYRASLLLTQISWDQTLPQSFSLIIRNAQRLMFITRTCKRLQCVQVPNQDADEYILKEYISTWSTGLYVSQIILQGEKGFFWIMLKLKCIHIRLGVSNSIDHFKLGFTCEHMQARTRTPYFKCVN